MLCIHHHWSLSKIVIICFLQNLSSCSVCLCQATQRQHYATLSPEQKEKLAKGPSLADFIEGDVDNPDSSTFKYEGILTREGDQKVRITLRGIFKIAFWCIRIQIPPGKKTVQNLVAITRQNSKHCLCVMAVHVQCEIKHELWPNYPRLFKILDLCKLSILTSYTVTYPLPLPIFSKNAAIFIHFLHRLIHVHNTM